MNSSDIYFSLDEARDETRRRWNDKELKEKIKTDLGDKFNIFFDTEAPQAYVFRQLISPDNGLFRFMLDANYLGCFPAVIEYLDDIFVSINEEKKGLGRLRLTKDKTNVTLDIMDFHSNERKRLKEINVLTGETLVEFHHNLLDEFGVDEKYLKIKDCSNWFHSIGKAKDYYYYFLLHFVSHGVLFETFSQEIEEEDKFVSDIIKPALTKIYTNYGLKPIIINMYPMNQTKREDFYWFSYPPYINNKLASKLFTGGFNIKNINI